jgi:hypothetical protein
MKTLIIYFVMFLQTDLEGHAMDFQNLDTTKTDSTWCPIIEHTKQCRFRLGPWQPKGREYVRYRYCYNVHKIKQQQRRKR